MDNMVIAERLRSLRTKINKSQAEVAKACGLTASAYANYENGIRIPKDIHKAALAKYFNTTVDALFFSL